MVLGGLKSLVTPAPFRVVLQYFVNQVCSRNIGVGFRYIKLMSSCGQTDFHQNQYLAGEYGMLVLVQRPAT